MAVYVDNMLAKFGRLIMCHMIADTEAELHAMADQIGVSRRWYQRDHYDIALTKRALAVAAGAQEITWRDCGLMMMDRRRQGWDAPLLTPAEALGRLARAASAATSIAREAG